VERIPEPELMDEAEQAAAYARADFEEPHSRFIALLSEKLEALPATGFALDLGSGSGDIALRFARAFAQWEVDGVDGAPAMLAFARRDAEEAGLGRRVRFTEAFLPAGSLPRDAYGLVFSNSLLHHLSDPAILWESVRRFAAPGGSVFVMDLLRPDSRERAQKLVDCYAANEPDVLRRDFYNSLLAAYRLEEISAQLAAAGLAQALRVEVVSDRHFIAFGSLAVEKTG